MAATRRARLSGRQRPRLRKMDDPAINLFMMFEPLRGWRHVEVTERRTKVDFAHVIRDLIDVHYPQAETIVLVMDNLNTHKVASLYEAFPPPKPG